MTTLLAVLFFLLVALEPVNCQTVGRYLQPWLQGVIALTVFLALTGTAFIVCKLCCQDEEKDPKAFEQSNMTEMAIPDGTEGNYAITAEHFRCEDGQHVYEHSCEHYEHSVGNDTSVGNDCGNTSDATCTEM